MKKKKARKRKAPKPPTTTAIVKSKRGPATPEGLAICAKNSLKDGLFANTLLPHESLEQYAAHIEGIRQSLQPVGYLEEQYVENIAWVWWKKGRMVKHHTASAKHLIECRTIHAEFETTMHILEPTKNPPPPVSDDLIAIGGMPNGPALVKSMTVETHCTREIGRLMSQLEKLQLKREKKPDVVLMFTGQNSLFEKRIPRQVKSRVMKALPPMVDAMEMPPIRQRQRERIKLQ